MMNDPTRPALEALRNEFLRASLMYPPLYHQQLVDFYKRMTLRRIRGGPSPQPTRPRTGRRGTAPLRPGFDWFGRFYGNEAGLTEFKQLADSLYAVIRQLDPDWMPLKRRGMGCGV